MASSQRPLSVLLTGGVFLVAAAGVTVATIASLPRMTGFDPVQPLLTTLAAVVLVATGLGVLRGTPSARPVGIVVASLVAVFGAGAAAFALLLGTSVGLAVGDALVAGPVTAGVTLAASGVLALIALSRSGSWFRRRQ